MKFSQFKKLPPRLGEVLFFSFITLVIVLLMELSLGTRGLERIENFFLDARMRISSESLKQKEDSSRIVIVGLDENTNRQLEHIPRIFWIGYFAEIIEALLDGGADLVGIDLLFETSGEEFLQKELQRCKVCAGTGFIGGEERLIKLLTTGRVVLPVEMDIVSRRFKTSIPRIANAVEPEDTGIVNLVSDSDGRIRRIPLFFIGDKGDLWQSLPVALFNKISSDKITFSPNTRKAFLNKMEIPNASNDILLFRKNIFPSFRVRYDLSNLETPYSFVDLLREARRKNSSYFKRFHGKVVLIGEETADLDKHMVPISVGIADRLSGSRISGVEILGRAVNSLLEKKFLVPASSKDALLIIFVMALFACVCASYFQPFIGVPILAFVLFGYWEFSIFQYKAGKIFLIAPVALAFLLGSIPVYMKRFYVEIKEKRRVRKILEGYVSKPVLQEVEKIPEQRRLSAKNLNITVLFLDIRDFTALSEKLPTSQLLQQLNEFLAVMIEIIHKNRGTLNKFTGDGLLAFWGAPLFEENSSALAAIASVKMQQNLELLNESWKRRGMPKIQIGIGVHSGEAMVGHIGSKERMEYTAIGKTVNLAARIEALNKNFGSTILFSDAVYKEVARQVEGVSLGMVQIRGMEREVEIFRILALRP